MTFVCGLVCLLVYQFVKARSMQWESFHFSSATAVCNHLTASGVHLQVFIFQICGIYSSS